MSMLRTSVRYILKAAVPKNRGAVCISSKPDDVTYIEIPRYIPRANESINEKKSRLIYQSRKRGIKETDLILSTFAHKYINSMSSHELEEYDRLINVPSNDWDIYYWASGVEELPEEFDGPIARKLIEHTRNEDRESRLHQPSLKPLS